MHDAAAVYECDNCTHGPFRAVTSCTSKRLRCSRVPSEPAKPHAKRTGTINCGDWCCLRDEQDRKQATYRGQRVTGRWLPVALGSQDVASAPWGATWTQSTTKVFGGRYHVNHVTQQKARNLQPTPGLPSLPTAPLFCVSCSILVPQTSTSRCQPL